MPATGKTKKAAKAKAKGKGKKNDLLAKPKRPMSAYNFFFKAVRAEILAESSSEGGEETSFEDIGRMIGQRWRNISEEDHAKYKELAAADSARYKKEMKDFYKDELTLMCQGGKHEDDAKAGDAKMGHAKASDADALVGSQQQQQQQLSNLSNHLQQQAVGASNAQQIMDLLQQQQEQKMPSNASSATNRANPSPNSLLQNLAGVGGGASSMVGSDPLRFMSSAVDDQIFWSLLQHHQQQAAPPTSARPNDTMMKLILAQKSSIEQRRQKLIQEINALQVRDALLDKMLAEELAALSGGIPSQPATPSHQTSNIAASSLTSGPAPAGAPGAASAPASMEQLAQLLQMQTAAAGSTGAGAGLGAAPISSMQALLGGSSQQSSLGGGFAAAASSAPAAMNDPASLVNMALQTSNPLPAEEILKQLMGQSQK